MIATGGIAATLISIDATGPSIIPSPGPPGVPVSVSAAMVVSTCVLSTGSSGETKSKTVPSRSRVEKTTGSRGDSKEEKTSTDTLSHDPEKSGIELRPARVFSKKLHSCRSLNSTRRWRSFHSLDQFR